MSSKLARPLSVLAVSCLSVSAQSVLPALMAGVEGASATNVPFGSNLECRFQCIYDAEELPWVGPRVINGFSIRADNGSPNSPGLPIAAKGYLTIWVKISTTHASSSATSGVFEDNYGEDVTGVITAAQMLLPAQPTAPAGPRPANVDFAFAAPWWYGLTPARPNLPAPANLLIEIQIVSQPAGAYPIDNLGGCSAPVTTFGNQGPLCAVPGSQPPTISSDPSMTAGAAFSWYVDFAPASALFFIAFAVTDQGGLGGNPAFALPYPMFDPQNPTQPSAALSALHWSAPDCWLNLDPGLTALGIADTTGHGILQTQLPAGRDVVGFELFAQGVILSQTSNPLGVITTEGRSSTVCGPLGVSRVFAFYDGSGSPPPPLPTQGSVQYGIAPIIEVW